MSDNNNNDNNGNNVNKSTNGRSVCINEENLYLYINEMRDMKEGLFKLIDVISATNQNIKILSDNQSHLNGKINQLLSECNSTTES